MTAIFLVSLEARPQRPSTHAHSYLSRFIYICIFTISLHEGSRRDFLLCALKFPVNKLLLNTCRSKVHEYTCINLKGFSVHARKSFFISSSRCILPTFSNGAPRLDYFMSVSSTLHMPTTARPIRAHRFTSFF